MTTTISSNLIYIDHNQAGTIPERVSHTYKTPTQFRLDVLQALLHQSSIFAAVSLAKETNRLNGYQVLSKYDLKIIKLHYLSNNIKTEREEDKYQNAINKFIEKQKQQNSKNKSRLLQKGYLKLLTESAYKRSI